MHYKAFYGPTEITDRVSSLLNDGVFNANVDNTTLGGDTDPGVHKHLTVVYSHDSDVIQNHVHFAVARENDTLNVEAAGLYVIRAYYGKLDVTDRVRQEVKDHNKLTIQATNGNFTDGNPGKVKHLSVIYGTKSAGINVASAIEGKKVHVAL